MIQSLKQTNKQREKREWCVDVILSEKWCVLKQIKTKQHNPCCQTHFHVWMKQIFNSTISPVFVVVVVDCHSTQWKLSFMSLWRITQVYQLLWRWKWNYVWELKTKQLTISTSLHHFEFGFVSTEGCSSSSSKSLFDIVWMGVCLKGMNVKWKCISTSISTCFVQSNNNNNNHK